MLPLEMGKTVARQLKLIASDLSPKIENEEEDTAAEDEAAESEFQQLYLRH